MKPHLPRTIASRAVALLRPLAGVAVATLAACASTPQVDAQWVDAQLGARSGLLHGARVLVACEAFDLVVRQICQDQVASDVVARGATPIFAPPETPLLTDRAIDGQLLGAARSAGAAALLVVTLAPAATDVSPGFSLGIGGFGFGSRSAVGVGVSAPIGGGTVTTGYAANGRITEVANGRLAWTARATAAPSSDVNGQLRELSKAVLDAADRAGLF
ncbi:MAG: hypothetical protein M3Z29_10230 [Pseudomonadota bacterium]|nr:hypothetical protein [Pseudomonadota bacterium]